MQCKNEYITKPFLLMVENGGVESKFSVQLRLKLNNVTNLNNKSIGITRIFFSKLEALKPRKYYFECAVFFFNVMSRNRILFSSETY